MTHPPSPPGSTASITASQLGLSPADDREVGARGAAVPKYRGVYAYGHPHLSREGEWMAGVLAAGEGAALAGGCAAALLRV